jgi:hypothetical protein
VDLGRQKWSFSEQPKKKGDQLAVRSALVEASLCALQCVLPRWNARRTHVFFSSPALLLLSSSTELSLSPNLYSANHTHTHTHIPIMKTHYKICVLGDGGVGKTALTMYVCATFFLLGTLSLSAVLPCFVCFSPLFLSSRSVYVLVLFPSVCLRALGTCRFPTLFSCVSHLVHLIVTASLLVVSCAPLLPTLPQPTVLEPLCGRVRSHHRGFLPQAGGHR